MLYIPVNFYNFIAKCAISLELIYDSCNDARNLTIFHLHQFTAKLVLKEYKHYFEPFECEQGSLWHSVLSAQTSAKHMVWFCQESNLWPCAWQQNDIAIEQPWWVPNRLIHDGFY